MILKGTLMTEPVHGYTDKTPDSVKVVNRNKLIEELLYRQTDAMRAMPDVDQRLVSVALTDFEKAFMALNRAVFKPTRLVGPIDTNELFMGLAQ